MIALTPVTSSNIDAIGFDPASSSLYIRFKPPAKPDPVTGEPRPASTVVYRGVTKALYTALVNSPSLGSFYHANIKRQFIGETLPQETED